MNKDTNQHTLHGIAVRWVESYAMLREAGVVDCCKLMKPYADIVRLTQGAGLIAKETPLFMRGRAGKEGGRV